MRRFPLVLFLAAVAAVAAGCSTITAPDKIALGPSDSVVTGTFLLATDNGLPLPVVAVQSQTQELDLTADQITVGADDTWSETTSYTLFSFLDGSQVSSQNIVSGTYTVTNAQINFVMTTGGTSTFAGSVKGDTLSVLFNNALLLYARQP